MISREANQLKVSGPLTLNTVAALMNPDISGGGTRLVMDLGQVEAVDSAAVSLLLVWLRVSLRSGVQLRFSNVPDNLLSLARLYGVADLLPVDERA